MLFVIYVRCCIIRACRTAFPKRRSPTCMSSTSSSSARICSGSSMGSFRLLMKLYNTAVATIYLLLGTFAILCEGSSKFSWKQKISLSSNFPLHAWWGKFRRQKRTSLPLIRELYVIENHRHNYGWRHRPVHIRTVTLPVFIPQSWTFQLREKIPFMRMPKKNEHGDVFLRVRIYEKCSSHNHKTIKQHSKETNTPRVIPSATMWEISD
jgi:hypothetical protein